jgi:hypothetical protein
MICREGISERLNYGAFFVRHSLLRSEAARVMIGSVGIRNEREREQTVFMSGVPNTVCIRYY